MVFANNRPALEPIVTLFDTNNIVIATRGSALALAQANMIFDQCRKAFPKLTFEIKIMNDKDFVKFKQFRMRTSASAHMQTDIHASLSHDIINCL